MKNPSIIFLLISFISCVPLNAQTWNTQMINPGTVFETSMHYKKDGTPIVFYLNGATIFASTYNGTTWNTQGIMSYGYGYSKFYVFQVDTQFYVYAQHNGYNVSQFYVFDSYLNGRVLNSIGEDVSAMTKFSTSSFYAVRGTTVYKFDIANELWESLGSFEGSAGVSAPNSIAISSDYKIWIPYRSNGILKMARSKTNGTWDTWFIDTSGDVGYYTQIEVEGTTTAHITYYDNTYQRLKYAKFIP